MTFKSLKLVAPVVAALFTLLMASAVQAATLKIAPKGEQLLFDQTTFTVKAGEKVKLTLNNTSGMQHNWVLVAPGTADKVAQDSITAGAAKGWLALGPSVLAHTKLVDPKKSDTIELNLQRPRSLVTIPSSARFRGMQ